MTYIIMRMGSNLSSVLHTDLSLKNVIAIAFLQSTVCSEYVGQCVKKYYW